MCEIAANVLCYHHENKILSYLCKVWLAQQKLIGSDKQLFFLFHILRIAQFSVFTNRMKVQTVPE